MITKLKDIATVSSGVTFRSRIEPSNNGGVGVIQMKDLREDNYVGLSEIIRIDNLIPKTNQLAKMGDIIFRSRGQTNTAVLLNKTLNYAVVAGPLLRVRIGSEKILPDYLLWWINQPSSQSYFASRAKGTMAKMVSKQCLEDLEINLPSLDQQTKVVKLFALSLQEQQILEKIKNLKAKYTHGVLRQIVSNENV